VQFTETEEMEGDIGVEGFELPPPPPPQAVIESRIAHSTKAYSSRVCLIFLLKWFWEKLPIRACLAKTPVGNAFTAREATARYDDSVCLGCLEPEALTTRKSLRIDAIGGLKAGC
jgi:hypothetical protein